MKYSVFFILGIYLFLSACGNAGEHEHGHDHDHDHNHDHEEEVISTTDGIHYGETISEEGAIQVSDLLKQLSNAEVVDDVTIIAKVGEVCQVKGCWMNVVDQAGASEEVFVQFKDYAYFMPKDLSGTKVALKGKASRELVSVDDLKHYAEDEGLSQKEIDAITEPETKLKFMASGVKILK